MDQLRLRIFSNYEYGDPVGFLVRLREVEVGLGEVEAALPERVRRLRTNKLKSSREMRDAALFCVGISARIGVPVRFAPVESEDFDFVATWLADGTQHFCPVQLKELVPEDLNPSSSIGDLFKKVSKYPDMQGLTVAVRWNRSGRFDLGSLNLPQNIKLGGLWVYGAISADQSRWAIWGDYAQNDGGQYGIAYDYPSG